MTEPKSTQNDVYSGPGREGGRMIECRGCGQRIEQRPASRRYCEPECRQRRYWKMKGYEKAKKRKADHLLESAEEHHNGLISEMNACDDRINRLRVSAIWLGDNREPTEIADIVRAWSRDTRAGMEIFEALAAWEDESAELNDKASDYWQNTLKPLREAAETEENDDR